jgi:hypothetical protein
MCLLTTQSKALRAKEDIIVYKRFFHEKDGKYTSPYLLFKYEIGRQKTIKLDKQFGRGSAFTHSDAEQADRDRHAGKVIYTVSRGYHSCKELTTLADTTGNVNLKCIIPKGAWYYEGYDGLMVSTDLIISEDELKN